MLRYERVIKLLVNGLARDMVATLLRPGEVVELDDVRSIAARPCWRSVGRGRLPPCVVEDAACAACVEAGCRGERIDASLST